MVRQLDYLLARFCCILEERLVKAFPDVSYSGWAGFHCGFLSPDWIPEFYLGSINQHCLTKEGWVVAGLLREDEITKEPVDELKLKTLLLKIEKEMGVKIEWFRPAFAYPEQEVQL